MDLFLDVDVDDSFFPSVECNILPHEKHLPTCEVGGRSMVVS